MNNLLIAQSGGPSVAINATVGGAVEYGLISGKIDRIFGAVHGIKGVLEDHLIPLHSVLSSPEKMTLLCHTPAAALGSCRYKLNDYRQNETDYETIIQVFRRHNIRYFIYIGGNDSMDTVLKLSDYCREKGINDIFVMGAPKTIDNDLAQTDHCPGFGSAAKYIATTFSELERDRAVYDDKNVTIVEVMGRDAGWLTAAAALSRGNGSHGPDLLYLCEQPLEPSDFVKQVKQKLSETTSVMVAVSEGIKNSAGHYLSEECQSGTADNFGHQYIAGAGRVLEGLVRDEIGCKVRAIELNLMQRCSSRIASATDLYESRMLGMKALSRALEGGSGEMACIRRIVNLPYEVSYDTADIRDIANHVKNVPASWILPDGKGVTREMIDYLYPLIQGEVPLSFEHGIPAHLKLF